MTDWTEKTAVAKYNEVLDGSQYQRAVMETMCGVWRLMGWAANQWVGVSAGGLGGTAVKTLRPVCDPSRPDVRLSVNAIRRAIKENCARTKPRDLEWTVDPATESPRDRAAAQVGHKRLSLHLMPQMALSVLREMNVWRDTDGSCIVRRCMMPREEGTPLVDPMGKPVVGEDGQPKVLQGGYEHWWEIAPPYELVRDPSANSPRFDNEEFVGHEKACPLGKVQAMFPDFKMPEGGIRTTMGELLQYQRELWSASKGSVGVGMSASESKQLGVMFCEGWYRGKGWKWTHHLIGWRDSGIREPGKNGVHALQFGRNGYYGLPLHHFVFDWPPGSPWGMGLAEELTPHQQLRNLAVTQWLRLILDAGGKYIINVNGLRDKKFKDVLESRYLPFVVNSRDDMKSVDRVAPPPMDQSIMVALARSDELFNEGAATSDVLRGVTSKRGESDKAVKTKIGQAEGPIMSMIDDDELVVNDLLTGTLADIGSTSSLEEMDTMLGGEFGADEIAAFLALDFEKSAPGVNVTRDSLRPRPPEESLRNYAAAVDSAMIDGPAARRAHMVRSGEGLDPLEEAAYWEQKAEIRAMRAGHQVEVNWFDDHDTHIWTGKYEKAQPSWRSFPPEVQKAVEEHLYQHLEMKAMLAKGLLPGGDGQAQQGGQPQDQPQSPGQLPEGQPGLGQSQVATAGVGGSPAPNMPPPQGPGVLPARQIGAPAGGPGM